jgi:predicted nucleic acid-binding protein
VQRAVRRAGLPRPAAEVASQLFASLRLRAVTEDLIDRAELLDPPGLRTLDALHLACALDLGPALDAFLCYDERLVTAARLHGLPVRAPGPDEVHEP